MIILKKVNQTNTILERYQIKNTGGDEQMILVNDELDLSRLLISPYEQIQSYDSCSLRIFISNAELYRTNIQLDLHNITRDWDAGIYKFSSDNSNLYGSNWYRYEQGNRWETAGGDYDTDSVITKLIDYQSLYQNVDFQNLDQSQYNHGFLIKFKDQQTIKHGKMYLYSGNSDSPYYPRYVYYVDDYQYITDGITTIDTMDNMYIDVLNLKNTYRQEQKVKLNIKFTPKYYNRDWTSSYWSNQNQVYILNESLEAKYSLYDITQFEEIQVIQYSDYTRVCSDGEFNYINFDMSSLQKNRKYKFQIKINGKVYHIRETFKIV